MLLRRMLFRGEIGAIFAVKEGRNDFVFVGKIKIAIFVF